MIIIGEKINATGEKIAQAIEKRDAEYISDVARIQDEADADVIDVNAGKGKIDRKREIEDMEWLIGVVESVTEKPVAIDSDNY
jgi:5-methyltetrahydrofolate corrinoid/iron sulfur protein methyltransferase